MAWCTADPGRQWLSTDITPRYACFLISWQRFQVAKNMLLVAEETSCFCKKLVGNSISLQSLLKAHIVCVRASICLVYPSCFYVAGWRVCHSWITNVLLLFVAFVAMGTALSQLYKQRISVPKEELAEVLLAAHWLQFAPLEQEYVVGFFSSLCGCAWLRQDPPPWGYFSHLWS